MINRRPITWGSILGASTHLLEWTPVLLHTMLKPQRDIWIFVGLALVLVRLISFCCLNLNVTTEANTWREGYRFALGWLGISILLLIIEFILFSNTNVLSRLDPHTPHPGIPYAFFWFILAIQTALEVLIAGIQTLIRARRDHCRTTNTFVN
jgi:TRAP-type C4-dicarboxylate transport system permease small subunit